LIFVAAYQKSLSVLYVDELLQRVKNDFAAVYDSHTYEYKNFTGHFNQLLRECEAKADEAKKGSMTMRSSVQPRSAGNKGGKNGSTGVSSKASKGAAASSGADGENDGDDDEPGSNTDGRAGDTCSDEPDLSSSDGNNSGGEKAFDVSKLKGGPPRGARGRGAPAPKAASKKEETAPKKKVMRNWNSLKNEEPSKLDFSDMNGHGVDHGEASDGDKAAPFTAGVSRMDVEEEVVEEVEIDEEELAREAAKSASASAPKKSSGLLGSFMSSLAMRVVGKGALTSEDLAPALADMKRKLMERNVAEEIAQNICDSVGRSLEGQKLSSFTGVSAFVRRAFEDALAGILNKRQVDILLDIRKAQARGKPYVIVFCGVNGVGKSTNLAKIAYWLGQHNIKVTIAACDTFRAGAVEQLKTHCARLQVPLYERGYEKDPAKVAFEAVKQAERDGRHVVLVDTAGRMQDNEPLMRALSNLINVNQPDLVLFVGEALVGNDAVDQLVKFNRALYDLAPTTSTTKHVIDGIVLTKFDTIDDKVGAAVSMVYSSGAPIMFVGCGQTYVDLKKLNVKSVVNSLLK